MWPETEIAKTERRRELVLSAEVNERIENNGLDNNIFSLTDLNYLSLTGTWLKAIPNEISELTNLQTLILHSNKLEKCCESIFKLSKLKILDLSNNELKNIPESVSTLSAIVSLNVCNNHLTDFPTLTDNSKLACLNLSHNNIELFPNVCNNKLTNLSELKLHANKIEEIPTNIDELPALKILDVSENNVKVLPWELAACSKLKELHLKSNPISDRRLKKLIDQCRTKQILDYVKQHSVKSTTGTSDTNTSQCTIDDDSDTKAVENEVSYLYKINFMPSNENVIVNVDNLVKVVREHIVCCVLGGIVFTPDLFKKFIQLQNKLHDKLCDKRNSATIATHDLKKIGVGKIRYTTFKPTEFKIQPLNKTDEITGDKLFSNLQTEAHNLRREKKRSTYSGIHKYLYLIEGKALYPCLLNHEGKVISFPPITNSEISKIEPSTTEMFLEVTSTLSQFVCKNVLSELIKETVILLESDLHVQPIKVFDSKGKLMVVYPSKNDLNFDSNVPIKVVRN